MIVIPNTPLNPNMSDSTTYNVSQVLAPYQFHYHRKLAAKKPNGTAW